MTYLDSLRATRAMTTSTLVLPGHGEPVTDHVALIDERFALHERRADEDPRPDRRAAAHGVRDRAGAVGQRRGDAGLPDAVGGARPRRPARRARRGRRAREDGVVRFEPAVAAGGPLDLGASMSARWPMLARSPVSATGPCRTRRRGSPPAAAREVVRSDSASTLASFQRRAPAAVAGVRAQRGPYAADLVGGDRGAGAGPAAHHRLFGAALGDVPRGGLGGPGPVVALAGAQRAVHAAARGRAARSASTTASATPVRSSAATAILIALGIERRAARRGGGSDAPSPASAFATSRLDVHEEAPRVEVDAVEGWPLRLDVHAGSFGARGRAGADPAARGALTA